MEKGQTSSSWYRKYSDGWVEQGGHARAGYYSRTVTTFPVPFKTTDYSISVCTWNNQNGDNPIWDIMTVQNAKAESFAMLNGGATTEATWFACGYS